MKKQVRIFEDTYQMLLKRQKALDFPISMPALVNGIIKHSLLQEDLEKVRRKMKEYPK